MRDKSGALRQRHSLVDPRSSGSPPWSCRWSAGMFTVQPKATPAILSQ